MQIRVGSWTSRGGQTLLLFSGKKIAGVEEAPKGFSGIGTMPQGRTKVLRGEVSEGLSREPVAPLSEQVVSHLAVLHHAVGQGQVVKAENFTKIGLSGSIRPGG